MREVAVHLADHARSRARAPTRTRPGTRRRDRPCAAGGARASTGRSRASSSASSPVPSGELSSTIEALAAGARELVEEQREHLALVVGRHDDDRAGARREPYPRLKRAPHGADPLAVREPAVTSPEIGLRVENVAVDVAPPAGVRDAMPTGRAQLAWGSAPRRSSSPPSRRRGGGSSTRTRGSRSPPAGRSPPTACRTSTRSRSPAMGGRGSTSSGWPTSPSTSSGAWAGTRPSAPRAPIAFAVAFGLLAALLVRRGAAPIAVAVALGAALVQCLLFAETRAQSFAYPLFVLLLWILLGGVAEAAVAADAARAARARRLGERARLGCSSGSRSASPASAGGRLASVRARAWRLAAGDLVVSILAVGTLLVTPYGSVDARPTTRGCSATRRSRRSPSGSPRRSPRSSCPFVLAPDRDARDGLLRMGARPPDPGRRPRARGVARRARDARGAGTRRGSRSASPRCSRLRSRASGPAARRRGRRSRSRSRRPHCSSAAVVGSAGLLAADARAHVRPVRLAARGERRRPTTPPRTPVRGSWPTT